MQDSWHGTHDDCLARLLQAAVVKLGELIQEVICVLTFFVVGRDVAEQDAATNRDAI